MRDEIGPMRAARLAGEQRITCNEQHIGQLIQATAFRTSAACNTKRGRATKKLAK
jgi:hypothetical protein